VERRSPTDTFLTTAEVGDRLRLAPSAVRRIDPDELPVHVVGTRGVRRYRSSDVMGYLSSRRAIDREDIDELRVERGPYRRP
jgi:hypothetical protein